MEELLWKMQSAMTVRGLTALTQESYLRQVRKIGEYFGTHPAELGPEEVERYLWYLTAMGRQASTRNQVVSGLRFLYTVVLKRPYDAA